MEIQALKLVITEQDLNALALKHLPQEEEVRKLRLRVTPEGVHVNGVYQMLFGVSFETVWTLAVDNGKFLARLDRFKALGIPLTLLKSMIVSTIEEAIRGEPALRVEEDTIHLDLDRLLSEKGVFLSTNLTRIQCQEGQLIIEGGTQ